MPFVHGSMIFSDYDEYRVNSAYRKFIAEQIKTNRGEKILNTQLSQVQFFEPVYQNQQRSRVQTTILVTFLKWVSVEEIEEQIKLQKMREQEERTAEEEYNEGLNKVDQ